MKQNQDDGARRMEELQEMLKGEHSDKMDAMKKLVEQQLRDEHAGALQAHSAAHAASSRDRGNASRGNEISSRLSREIVRDGGVVERNPG